MFRSLEREILNPLREWLEDRPEDLPLVMDAISDGIKNYQNGVKRERSALAQNVITTLLLLTKKSKMVEKLGLSFFIDAAFYHFPNGNPDGHAPISREFFIRIRNMLVKDNYISDPTHYEWLKRIKGIEYYNWAKKVVEWKEN